MNTLTLTLSTATRTALQDQADSKFLSLERHINELLVAHVSRPTWAEVSEAAAFTRAIEALEGERDRARDSAILHEGDAYQLRETIIEAVAVGDIVVSVGFFTKVGIPIPEAFLARRGKAS